MRQNRRLRCGRGRGRPATAPSARPGRCRRPQRLLSTSQRRLGAVAAGLRWNQAEAIHSSFEHSSFERHRSKRTASPMHISSAHAQLAKMESHREPFSAGILRAQARRKLACKAAKTGRPRWMAMKSLSKDTASPKAVSLVRLSHDLDAVGTASLSWVARGLPRVWRRPPWASPENGRPLVATCSP